MRSVKIIFFIIIMFVFTACEAGEENSHENEKAEEISEELKMINSSECDENLLKIVQKNFQQHLIDSQMKHENKIYRCFSVYNNEKITIEELLTEEEKKELFENEEYDLAAMPASDKFYKITLDENDERYEELKNSFVTVLLIYDKTGEKLLNSMTYKGAIDCRIKKSEKGLYWEISELNSIDIYYKNKNKNTIICYDGWSNNSIYDLEIMGDKVNEAIFVSDEKKVRYECDVSEEQGVWLFNSEIRTLTIKEIVADKELRDLAEKLAKGDESGNFYLNTDKYGRYNNMTNSGFVGAIYITTDGYGILILQQTPFYFKYSKEEYLERYKNNATSPFLDYIDNLKTSELKLLYIDGEINPELIKEIEIQ